MYALHSLKTLRAMLLCMFTCQHPYKAHEHYNRVMSFAWMLQQVRSSAPNRVLSVTELGLQASLHRFHCMQSAFLVCLYHCLAGLNWCQLCDTFVQYFCATTAQLSGFCLGMQQSCKVTKHVQLPSYVLLPSYLLCIAICKLVLPADCSLVLSLISISHLSPYSCFISC